MARPGKVTFVSSPALTKNEFDTLTLHQAGSLTRKRETTRKLQYDWLIRMQFSSCSIPQKYIVCWNMVLPSGREDEDCNSYWIVEYEKNFPASRRNQAGSFHWRSSMGHCYDDRLHMERKTNLLWRLGGYLTFWCCVSQQMLKLAF